MVKIGSTGVGVSVIRSYSPKIIGIRTFETFDLDFTGTPWYLSPKTLWRGRRMNMSREDNYGSKGHLEVPI